MKTQNKKGFTLIELLVVITIIGILATGATAVFTSQIQRARDSSRIQDITALRGAIEQVYQERGQYPLPQSANDGARYGLGRIVDAGYMDALPIDKKTNERCLGSSDTETSPCDYLYGVDITSGVRYQRYNISTGIENDGNKTQAESDGGHSDYRIELGNGLGHASLNTGMTAEQFNNTPGNSCATTSANYAWIKGDCE